jgi:hypothetical protein
LHCLAKGRQCSKREAQTRQIPRSRRTQRDAGEDALHIADRTQPLAQCLVTLIASQFAHSGIARPQQRLVRHGSVQAAPQSACAHGGHRGVKQREQGRLVAIVGAAIKLEVTTRDGIDLQRRFARLHVQSAKVG